MRKIQCRQIMPDFIQRVGVDGTNSRQIQAISDEIHSRLKKLDEHPASIEGYQNAEWVLMDYGDFLVHIFSEKAREYYDLERLWRDAKAVAWASEAT